MGRAKHCILKASRGEITELSRVTLPALDNNLEFQLS
ncbi:uncharacterized protein G2W53_001324 [Senna tora]|uniref:Uncharacterized protein n=1 Tax=Senna tora TaxID=362788 RepID=A0A834XFQ2_9FABA|nr:uncharacterized protein G2W53_001324 [Senna tora]